MAIQYQENGRIFTLHTDHSTYQMKADSYGNLLHLYYGDRTEGSMEYLLTFEDRGFHPTHMRPVMTGPIPWMPFPRNIHIRGRGTSEALPLQWNRPADPMD